VSVHYLVKLEVVFCENSNGEESLSQQIVIYTGLKVAET